VNSYNIISKIRPIELAEAIKWLIQPKRVIVRARELTLSLDPLSNFGGTLLSRGDYEPELTDVVSQLLKPGQTFVDVGANEGWYSLVAAGIVGDDGSVISIEPQERCWAPIDRNFTLNQMLNYRLVPYAVGSIEEEIEMFLYPSLNGEASTLVGEWRRSHFRRQKTKVIRLDSLAATLHLQAIDLVKIDCEGYELEVLRGAEHLLSRGLIRRVLVELHPRQLAQLGVTEANVRRYPESLGYWPTQIDSVVVWVKKSSAL